MQADYHESSTTSLLYFRGRNRQTGMGLILLIILVVLLIGAAPTWPYSRGWGYYPSGGLGLVIVIILILWFLRVI